MILHILFVVFFIFVVYLGINIYQYISSGRFNEQNAQTRSQRKVQKILKKIVVQGNNREIQNLFDEIWTVHRKTFNEDNDPTLIDFIVENMISSIVKECSWSSRESIKSLIDDVVDRLQYPVVDKCKKEEVRSELYSSLNKLKFINEL